MVCVVVVVVIRRTGVSHVLMFLISFQGVISEKNTNKFHIHVVVNVGTTTCKAVHSACYDELCCRHHFGGRWGTAFTGSYIVAYL